MKKRAVVFTVVALIVIGAFFAYSATSQSRFGIFGSLGPYVYRHRVAMCKMPGTEPLRVEVFHLKGINSDETENLIKKQLLAGGYSKESVGSNPSIVYDHRSAVNQVFEIEIFPAKPFNVEGTVLVSYRPITPADQIIGRITNLGRDPVEKPEVLTDSPIHFLGEP